jgi:hypothetical protein
LMYSSEIGTISYRRTGGDIQRTHARRKLSRSRCRSTGKASKPGAT